MICPYTYCFKIYASRLLNSLLILLKIKASVIKVNHHPNLKNLKIIHRLHQYQDQNPRKTGDQMFHIQYQHPPIIIITKHHILLQKLKTTKTKTKLLSMMTYLLLILAKVLLFQLLCLFIAQLKIS